MSERELKNIPIDLIESSPNPSREVFEDISALASTIKRHGLLQPLLVKKRANAYGWEVVVGERRLRACRKAGLRRVPCIEVDAGEEQILQMQLVENLQRSDLKVFEEIRLVETLRNRFQLEIKEIAAKTGLSHGTVKNYLTIARLPDEYVRMIERNTQNQHALTISKALDLAEAHLPPDRLKEIIDHIRREGLSRHQLKKKLAKDRPSKILRVAGSKQYWRELTKTLKQYARYWSEYCRLEEWETVSHYHLQLNVTLPKDLSEEAGNE